MHRFTLWLLSYLISSSYFNHIRLYTHSVFKVFIRLLKETKCSDTNIIHSDMNHYHLCTCTVFLLKVPYCMHLLQNQTILCFFLLLEDKLLSQFTCQFSNPHKISSRNQSSFLVYFLLGTKKAHKLF